MNYDDDYKKKQKPFVMKESGWTVEDYYEMPDDGNRYEIGDGILELLTAPAISHQQISFNIVSQLKDCCSSEYIILYAPIDVILSRQDIRQPDLIMIHRSRTHIMEERAVVGPPDLVVEILSPSTAKKDRTKKKTGYARFGVQEYWIVDPANRTVEQYVLPPEDAAYELLELYDESDAVLSDRLPCVSFLVKDALSLK